MSLSSSILWYYMALVVAWPATKYYHKWCREPLQNRPFFGSLGTITTSDCRVLDELFDHSTIHLQFVVPLTPFLQLLLWPPSAQQQKFRELHRFILHTRKVKVKIKF